MIDPISDFLTRIRNAVTIHKADVVMPYSKLKHNLANLLVAEGYLQQAEKVDNQPSSLRVVINYNEYGQAMLQHLKRISTPGRRVYVGYEKLRPVCSGRGIAVLSTSHGLVTDKQAKQHHLGGELMCEIW